jgi:NTP pyrophosphatase (non-canonical NTP hydrolase)
MTTDYHFPSINSLAVLINEWADGMGWHEPGTVRGFDGMMMNVVSEAAEAQEEWRHGRDPNETYWKWDATGANERFKVEGGKTWVRDYEAEAEHGARGDFSAIWTELTTERLRIMPNTYGRLKPEGIPTELADIIIRTLHVAAYYGIDIAGAIADKMVYNSQRPYRHGGKRS